MTHWEWKCPTYSRSVHTVDAALAHSRFSSGAPCVRSECPIALCVPRHCQIPTFSWKTGADPDPDHGMSRSWQVPAREYPVYKNQRCVVQGDRASWMKALASRGPVRGPGGPGSHSNRTQCSGSRIWLAELILKSSNQHQVKKCYNVDRTGQGPTANAKMAPHSSRRRHRTAMTLQQQRVPVPCAVCYTADIPHGWNPWALIAGYLR